jgi:diguanylate cyclase (GGDEF)-like protein
MRPLLGWGAALLLLAAGLGLVGLEGEIPDPLSLTLGNLLLLGAALALRHCARALHGVGGRDPAGWGLLLGCFAALHFWNGFAVSVALRNTAVTFVFAGLLAAAAHDFYRAAPPREAASLRCIAAGLMVFAMAAVLVALEALPGAALPLVLLAVAPACTLLLVGLLVGRLSVQLGRLAATDPLTGALNDRAIVEAFGRETARARRGGASLALALLDVDSFQRINQAHGYAAGDRVLREVALTLRATVRNYDSLGRHGGDRFALLLPGTSAEAAVALAERIRAAVEFKVGAAAGIRRIVTVSIGIAASELHGESWDAMFRTAEAALQSAKRAGRNRALIGLSALAVPPAIPASASAGRALPPVTPRPGYA